MRVRIRLSYVVSLVALGSAMVLLIWPEHGDLARVRATSGSKATSGSRTTPPAFDRHAVETSFEKLPMQFEENRGQTNSHVKFLSHGRGYTFFLTEKQAVLAMENEGTDARHETSSVLRLGLQGANPDPEVIGESRLPGHVNYFIGNNPSKWHTAIPTYSRVAYRNVYPGVNEVFYGDQGQLEYDLMVAPGARPDSIAMRVEGASHIAAQRDGSLKLYVGSNAVELRAPVAYQEVNGGRKLVAASYDVATNNVLRFHLGAYNRTEPLVIDPMLVYSTFLGGSQEDQIIAGRTDANGNVFVTGFTFSTDFPLSVPFQSMNTEAVNGNQIVIVSELAAAGNNLIFSTYLGGTGVLSVNGGTGDDGDGIAIDSSGNIYIAGETYSADFPLSSGAYQVFNQGSSIGAQTAFLTVLDPGGAGLKYSSYLGGNNGDTAFAVAADSSGNAYVGGATASTNFPITAGAPQPVFTSQTFEGFLSKINTTLSGTSSLTYSTFVGGSGNSSSGDGDEVFTVHTDASGDAYIGGHTASVDLPTTSGAFEPTCAACANGNYGGFVGQYNTNSGGGITYLTYLSGSTADEVTHLVVDASGNAFVTGDTFSTDFPTTAGAFQTTLNSSSGSNAFVTDLNANGTGLNYSTYLGGSGTDLGFGIAVDSSDNAYVTGQTSSTDFPLVNAIQSTNNAAGISQTNAFVSEVNPSGSALLFSTYMGGSGSSNSVNGGDTGWSIDVDTAGNMYVAGTTGSPDFPTASPFQSGLGGFDDGFITEISPTSGGVSVMPTSLQIFSTAIGTAANGETVTLTNGTSDSITVSSILIGGTNAPDFTETNSCLSGAIAAGGTCTIDTTYTPSTGNPESAQITITFANGAPSPIVIPMTGAIGDFSLVLSSGSVTLTAGDSTTLTTTLTGTGAGFAGTVTLTCTGAPSAATCAIAPGSVDLSGTTSQQATITINTTARSLLPAIPPAGPSRQLPLAPLTTAMMLALLGAGFAVMRWRPSVAYAGYRRASLLALLAALILLGGMTACSSSSSGGGGTPAGTYTLTITGTAGNLMHSQTLTLTVQ